MLKNTEYDRIRVGKLSLILSILHDNPEDGFTEHQEQFWIKLQEQTYNVLKITYILSL